MKKLSEVTNAMPDIVNPMGDGTRSSTCQHGLTTTAGSQTGQSKSPKAEEQPKTENSTRQQSEECYEQKTPISECIESKKKLTKLVTSCFKALNTYGATNEALESSVMIMQMTLGKYDYATVRNAFEVHMNSSSDMPKPADIVKIISPPPEPKKWCKVTFLEIKRKKRENVFTTFEEDKYCEDFLKAAVSANPDDREDLQNAITQSERENKTYWLE